MVTSAQSVIDDTNKAFWDVWWSTFEDVQLETTHGFVEAGSEVVYSQTTHIRGREGIEVVDDLAHLRQAASVPVDQREEDRQAVP